ncbi:MAG TPA: DUF2520 domain-containing protein [Pyrinomonadaceae bacterium]
MPSVSIIGVGRVGGALALALQKAGYEIEHLVHRDATTAKLIAPKLPGVEFREQQASFSFLTSDIVLITTPDPLIGPIAERLSAELRHKPTVLHTSGSLSSNILSRVAEFGFGTGSMHPLVSISDAITGALSFEKGYFCVEGDETGERIATSMVQSLGGIPFTIPPDCKPLYHAAAVMASGHFVSLIDISIELLNKCGVRPESAKSILLPLIRTTLGNLESKNTAGSLTGSFARADSDAITRHLAAIDDSNPLIREVYLLLGERSIDLAAAAGVSPDDLAKLRESISIAKRKSE